MTASLGTVSFARLTFVIISLLTAVITYGVIMPDLKQQLLCLATLAVVGPLAAGPSARKTERLIDKAYVDSKGTVHVVEHGGSDKSIPREKDQVGTSMVKIAEDRKVAGWTAEYSNCCTSYPIPMLLVVYHDGRVRQRLGNGMMIYDWRFWDDGRKVAFCTGTVHGDSGGHCELHDVKSGRALKVIQGHVTDNSPPWAQGLNN